MSDNAIDRLKEMVNKPFLYQNEEIVILNYCDGTGDDGTEVEKIGRASCRERV